VRYKGGTNETEYGSEEGNKTERRKEKKKEKTLPSENIFGHNG
jgi:hypothetical protein